MQKALNWHQVNELACKHLNQWCVYVSNGLDFNETFDVNEQKISDEAIFEIIKTEMKTLYGEEKLQHILGDLIMGALFAFDSEEAAWKFYRIFELEHVDSSACYANIISPIDGILTENT